jgi:hypothetical protein
MMKRGFGMLVSLCLCFAANLVSAQSSAQRVRGDIVSWDGTTLVVRPAEMDQIHVKLAADTRVMAVSQADVSAIASGAFVGVTAVPQPDGTLSAREVHIFPESMRGTGEGHRPMASQSGATMTNATVAGVAQAPGTGAPTMTNATVDAVVKEEQARRLSLRYNGGEKVVILEPRVPVVLLEPGDRSLLVAGAHVSFNVTQQDDGSLVADRITVGKNGTVPPM